MIVRRKQTNILLRFFIASEISGRKLTLHPLKYSKSSYDANILFDKIPRAIENEKRFCEDIAGLKTNVGSNIGRLISELQGSV